MITAANFAAANADLNTRRQPVLALEIDGYSRVFTSRRIGIANEYVWIVSVEGGDFQPTPLDGTAALNPLTVSVVDKSGAFTADLPGITLEGKTCRLKTGFVGLAYGDYVTLFTGQVDQVPTSSDPGGYDIVCKDTRLTLQQVIYTTGDDGQPIDGDHPKTVLGNPLDIAKSIMLDYCGLPTAAVDVDALDTARDELFAGVTFEFHLTSAPDALEFLEAQIMKPLGGYLRVDNVGKIRPHFFQPVAGAAGAVATLNRRNIVGTPQMLQADLVNVVTFRFDKDDSGDSKFASETQQLNTASITKYGQQGQHIVESDGLRSGFQGYYLAALTANAIFARYGDKNPTFTCDVLWDGVLLESGDLVLVTHELMPDRTAGVMGIVGRLFEVEDRTPDFSAFTVSLKLVDASAVSKYGAFRIAPDTIADWPTASSADRARYMFIASAAGKYSDDTDAHPLA